MVFIIADTWRNNGAEVIPVDNIKKWLNEKHIETELGHSNLAAITLKYPKDLRKKRQELRDFDDRPYRKFLRKDFGIQVIMDYRTVQAVKFRTKLDFKQYDVIMTQEQSILTKLDRYFDTEDKIFNTMFWDTELICMFQSINLLLKWMN